MVNFTNTAINHLNFPTLLFEKIDKQFYTSPADAYNILKLSKRISVECTFDKSKFYDFNFPAMEESKGGKGDGERLTMCQISHLIFHFSDFSDFTFHI